MTAPSDTETTEGTTRRNYLSAGLALLSSGVLAGCLGGTNEGASTETAHATATDTTDLTESNTGVTATTGPEATRTTPAASTEATRDTRTEPNTTGDKTEKTEDETGTTKRNTTTGDTQSYTVTAAPMGEVTFETVPKKVFTIYSQYADMAVALGYGENVNATYVPEMVGPAMNHYYDRLDGVSFEWKGLKDPLGDGLSKELLYSLDSDVHLADPAWASTQKNWGTDDVEEIRTEVGPWFGNFYSGTHADPPDAYADRYEYYDLWDLFGKVAGVFGEQERYNALDQVHSELLSTIQSKLPPENEHPTAVRVTLSKDTFYTYHINWPGYWQADTRPLGATDAFAEKDWGQLWGEVGLEAMAEADPDVILHLWGTTPNYDIDGVRDSLKTDSVGKHLSAVENDRVYAQGLRYQGPITNLFQLEMAAKQLYPDQFGAWPAYHDGDSYPEIPSEQQLFDRERVAAIITGDR